jgi:arabinose-5-phosphate isomerase
MKGFRREDFARLHPGGRLGRMLLTKVRDVMLTTSLPIVPPTATMREAVVLLAERRGIVLVAEKDAKLLGLLTTGDLTRLMEKEQDFFPVRVDTVMVRQPKVAHADELGSAVVFRMEKHGIMAMPVLEDDQTIVGVVHLHDLMRAGAA